MRVVIAEDEALMRGGLALVLEQGGFDVVGQVDNAVDLLRLAADQCPDLVITDIRMPPTHTDEGLRAALEIRATQPLTSVLVLSQHVQREYALKLLSDRSGGVGYLLKQRITHVSEFCYAAMRVAEGGTALDEEVVRLMLARADRGQEMLAQLTHRQHDVLGLVAEGYSNLGIARALQISEKAVAAHTRHIYEQMGIYESDDHHRRVLAVVRWLTEHSASTPS